MRSRSAAGRPLLLREPERDEHDVGRGGGDLVDDGGELLGVAVEAERRCEMPRESQPGLVAQRAAPARSATPALHPGGRWSPNAARGQR